MARAATASPSGESIDSRSTHGDEGTDSGSGDGTRGGEAGWTGWVAMAVFDSACGTLIDLSASAVLSCTAIPSVDPDIDDVAVPTKPKGCDDSRPMESSTWLPLEPASIEGGSTAATVDVSNLSPVAFTRATPLVVGDSGKLSDGTKIQLHSSGQKTVLGNPLPEEG